MARVLSRCEELGYVDDRAFAAAFVRDRIRLKPRGVFRLRAELRGKGVGESDAEAGIRRAFRETGTTERELLERAAEERWRRVGADEPRAARRRLFDYLRRRGFPYAEIRDVVEEYLEGR